MTTDCPSTHAVPPFGSCPRCRPPEQAREPTGCNHPDPRTVCDACQYDGPDAMYRRQYDAGIVAGRRDCEATHRQLRAEAQKRCMRTHGAFYASGQARGRRQGTLAVLAGCLGLAIVAGWLGRRFR